MKIAVVANTIGAPGWSTDWMNLCAANSIEHREFDSFDPDLVTLDVMMPGLTTSEIFKKT